MTTSGRPRRNLIPDTPFANIAPGQKGVKHGPINRMVAAFILHQRPKRYRPEGGQTTTVRGIAFGGDVGLAKVLFSADSGGHWQEARLGRIWANTASDSGKSPCAFHRQGRTLCDDQSGQHSRRCPARSRNWNGAGFMRNVIESVSVRTA